MSSLATKMPATVEQVLQAESGRTGWISIVSFKESDNGPIVSAISRYKRGYFYTLMDEGKLQIGKDQVVVGVD